MKNKKWQIPLTVVSVILAITLTVSAFQIAGLSGNKIKKKKEIKHTRLEYVDKDFHDYLDDVVNDLNNKGTTTTGGNSAGDSEPPNTDDDNGNSENSSESSEITDDMDWMGDNDNEKEDYSKYTSLIPKNGTAVSGSAVRNINVTTSKTVFSDFWGMGGTFFPEILSDNAVGSGYNSVAWEFERHKILNAKTTFARTLIDMDAIITDTEEDPERTDYQNNSDYRYYMSGVYSFDNDSAESLWKILDCAEEAGTNIIFNTGWKVARRIQSWYPATSKNAGSSAPYDINAFVRANIAWLLECQSRGYDNIRYIDFGNEVNWGGDFVMHEDSVSYHTKLITLMCKAIEYAQDNTVHYKALDKNGNLVEKSGKLKGGIQMLVCDEAPANKTLENWVKRLNEGLAGTLGNKRPTEQSIHRYYGKSIDKTDIYGYSDYDNAYTFLNRFRELLGRPFITEFFASSASCDADLNAQNDEHTLIPGDWDTSYASYFIAAANSGAHGLGGWEYGTSFYATGSYLKEHTFADGSGALFSVGEIADKYKVTTNYRLVSLLDRYVPAHSDVLLNIWEGDDLRVSSFKLSDGNYTFVVEAKKTGTERNIKLNLDKAVGKLYRYRFSDTLSDSENRKLQGTVIRSDKSLASSATISDTIDGEYGVYVYSTKAPVSQVRIDKALETIQKSGSLTLNAELLDVAAADNGGIEWEITAASKKSGASLEEKELMGSASTRGSISKNGSTCTYTPGSAAQSGDSVAIRATLLDKNGKKTDTYAVSVIFIA